MIYELVLRNFDCSLDFVFSLLLLQPFNFSPVSFACNFQDWGCVILREIDFRLKICWSIPCFHPPWKVHTWTGICASLNHRKKTKANGSRLIPRKHTETLVLLSVYFDLSIFCVFNWNAECKAYSYTVLENKAISLFCWNETKSSLFAKSGIACFKNVWLLSVLWNEPRSYFALRRYASTINLLSLLTKQSQNL